jgi:hypothetical protein
VTDNDEYVHDLRKDLENSELIIEKIKNDVYAQNLYAAMCNMQWIHKDVLSILKEDMWSISWRGAGRLVSDLRIKHNFSEDYLNYYCSGIFEDEPNGNHNRWAKEGEVKEEIKNDLSALGWRPVPYEVEA